MAVSGHDVSTVEKTVLETIRELLEHLGGSRALAAVDLHAALDRDLGLGSLELVELLSRLEVAFGVELSESVLAEAGTAADLVRAVLSSGAAAVPALAADRVLAPTPSLPVTAQTLVEVLARRAESEPRRPHLYLLDENGRESVVSYGALQAEAIEVAGGLAGEGVDPGSPVALMLPTGRDFFIAFTGILLAGGIPVPLYPPLSLDRIEEYATRQAGILRNCGAAVLVTVPQGRSLGHHFRSSAPSLRRVTTVEALRKVAGGSPHVAIAANMPALIQYTSGSTGDPKGVLLTHENLLANIRAIGEAMDLKSTDVGVSWLPLYHDMGLIGCWLTPLVFGFPVSIMSPLAFLSRPERWLWTIHARRATLSASPNFGYELCARRPRDDVLEGLDLSCWRGALNGAEPIDAGTIERFCARFARYGFRPESMKPVYGLAESSLALAVTPPHRPARIEAVAREPFEREGRVVEATFDEKTPLHFVSSGPPIPGHELRVVDEHGVALPERREGHLQFRGPSTMQEYFRNPSATQSVRRAGGWVSSGDRAFFIDEDLFVTGRFKDLIIHAGRNIYPQSIEELVADVEHVRRGCVVAFGVTDARLGTEKLVVVAETRVEDEGAQRELRGAIQTRLVDAIGVPPDDIVLVPPRTIPKTSSGKLRRNACRERYQRGELAPRKSRNRLLLLKLGLLSSGLWLRAQAARAVHFLYGIYVWSIAVTLSIPVWIASWVIPSQRVLARLARSGVRAFLFLAGYRIRSQGLAALGTGGPFVLVSNHASYIDPLPLIAGLPGGFSFVVKADAMHWPVMGRLLSRLGHLPVARDDVRESLSDTERLGEVLRRGRSLFFFPEGTFTAASGLRPFRLGAFKLAAESGAAVVPISLVGTRHLLRDGTWLPRPGKLELVVGSPIVPRSSTLAEVVRLREEAAEQIARHIGEPRLDLIAAGPERP